MMPPPSFVKDLHAYDPLLRVRFGAATGRWYIERKMPIRHPQLRGEAPQSERSARARDLAVGYAEGYVHVLSVDPDLLTWHHVAPALREADLHFAGDWEAMNRRLDEAEARWEREQDRKVDHWAEAASLDAADHIAWAQGRRVSLYQPEPSFEQRDGYLVRDRRVRT